jgi:hypothetical protein
MVAVFIEPAKLSKQAKVKKFQDWHDPLTCCNVCQSPAVGMVLNSMVYGKTVGRWPYIYLCLDCGGYTGTHKFTIYPIGLIADEPTRRARFDLHKLVDPVWQSGLLSRNEVYDKLALFAGQSRIHIGNLSAHECLALYSKAAVWVAELDFFSGRNY